MTKLQVKTKKRAIGLSPIALFLMKDHLKKVLHLKLIRQS